MNNTIKRALAMFLTVIMVVGMLPTSALAAPGDWYKDNTNASGSGQASLPGGASLMTVSPSGNKESSNTSASGINPGETGTIAVNQVVTLNAGSGHDNDDWSGGSGYVSKTGSTATSATYKGTAPGSVNITHKYKNGCGGTEEETYTINVIPFISAQSAEMTLDEADVEGIVSVNPAGCETVTFATEGIVSYSGGKFTALAVGETDYTISASKNGQSTGTITKHITVNPAVTAEDVTLHVGDTVPAAELYTFLPDDCEVGISDYDDSIVSYAGGSFTAEAIGTTDYTVTASAGDYSNSASGTIIVKPAVTAEDITLTIGESVSAATLYTSLPSECEIVISDYDESIVSYAGGSFTAEAVGSTDYTVTASLGDYSNSASGTITVMPGNITGLSISPDTELYVGDEADILVELQLKPDGDESKVKVHWTAGDASVAAVANGKVTGVTVGETTVTASAEGYTSNAVTVTVVAKPAVSLNKESFSLISGDKTPVDVIATPENIEDVTVEWEYDEEKISAVIDGNTCSIIPLESGSSVIKAKFTYTDIYGNEAVAEAEANIVTDGNVKSVSVSPKATTLTVVKDGETVVSQDTVDLIADVKLVKTDVTAPDIKWTTSDEAVATVDQTGKVTAVAAGTAIITANCDGIKDSCKVTVEERDVKDDPITHSYTITVNFYYANGKFIDSKSLTALGGASITNYRVPNMPSVKGYYPDTEDKTNYYVNVPNVNGDYTFDVYYLPGNTDFTVRYRLQELNGTYPVKETATCIGITEENALAYIGEAGKRQFPGFTQLPYDADIVIAADGTTAIDIKYDRDYYFVTFAIGEGATGVMNQYDRFGTKIVRPADPVRPGYTFAGWYKDAACTQPCNFTDKDVIPANNDLVIYANWTPATANYKVVHWLEKSDSQDASMHDSDHYSYEEWESKSGTTNTKTAATAKSYTGFVAPTIVQEDIAGDNSTVVNIYYPRNTYTLTFKYNSQTVHTITAKYGASILSHFQSGGKIYDSYSGYWWKDSSGKYFEKYVISLDIMPAGNITFNGTSKGTGRTIKYYVQREGTTVNKNAGWPSSTEKFDLYKSVPMSSGGTITYNEEYHDIEGFEKYSESQWKNNFIYGVCNLYYLRKSYDLDFISGTKTVKTDSVQYQASLSGKGSFVPSDAYRPPEVGSDYMFTGWFADPACTVPFNFSSTMPAANVAVYAQWSAPTYNVHVNIEGIDEQYYTKNITVSKGKTIPAAQRPLPGYDQREGYTFGGFFTEAGEPFNFELPVYREDGVTDIYISAKWINGNSAPVSIYYRIKDTDTLIASTTETTALIDSTKTYYAKIGSELNPGYTEHYYPVTSSSSITVKENAEENKVYFDYVFVDKNKYTVNYWLDGVLQEDDSKTVETYLLAVTEKYKQYDGYKPDAWQKNLSLEADWTKNVINFYYETDNKHAPVHVTHYVQLANEDGYEVYYDYTDLEALIGEGYSVDPLVIDGYNVNKKADGYCDSIAKLTKEGAELKLYYDRVSAEYVVRFVKEDKTTAIAEPKTESGRSGARITKTLEEYQDYLEQNVSNFSCYTLDEGASTLTIGELSESNNVITFVFNEDEVTIAYFAVPAAGGKVGEGNSFQETVGKISGTPSGATATANENYVFKGWFYDQTGKNPVPETWVTGNKLVPGKDGATYESVTYYAVFELNKFDVSYRYEGTVPTDAPGVPDTAKTAVGTGVTVAAAPTLAGYTFSGWTTTDVTVDEGGKFTMPSKNVAFKGSWSANSYNVKYSWSGLPEGVVVYDADGNEFNVTPAWFASASHKYGETFQAINSVGANTVVYTHDALGGNETKYVLGNWQRDDNDAVVVNGQNITMPANDVEISAVWTVQKDFKPESYTLTLIPNSAEYTYDGTEKSVSGWANEKFEVVSSTGRKIEVTVTGNVEAKTKGTNVGTYPINDKNGTITGIPVITYSGTDITNLVEVKYGTGELKINPAKSAEITLTANSSVDNVYDGTAKTVSGYTSNAADIDSTIVVTGPATAESLSKTAAGEYEFALTKDLYSASSDNYEEVKINFVPGKLVISKIKTEIIITAASDSRIYNGTPLTNDGYSFTENVLVAGDTLTAIVEGTITNAGSEPNVVTSYKVTNADGKDVTDCYTFGQSVNGTLTVNPRNITLVSGSAEKTYDGTALTKKEVNVGGDGFVSGEGAKYIVTGTVTNVAECKPENNTFTYELIEGTQDINYNISTTNGTLTITPAEYWIVTESATKTYDGTALTAPGAVNGLVDGETATVATTGTQTNVGSSDNTYGDVTWDSALESNYTHNTDKDVLGTLTVKKAKMTVTGTDDSKTYDGSVLTATAAVPSVDEGTTVSYSLDGEIWSTELPSIGKDVTAETTVSVKAENPNYETATDTFTLEITKRTVVLTSGTNSWTYDGTAHSEESVVPSGDGWAAGEGATYSNFATVTTVADSGTENNTFKYTLNDGTDADNYNISTTNGTLTINPAEYWIVTASDEKVYDGTPLTNETAEIKGLIGSEKATVKASGAQTDVGTSDNTYAETDIAWVTAKAENYRHNADKDELGKLVVTEFAGEIIAETVGGTKMYDGTPLQADVKVSGLPKGYTVASAKSSTRVTHVREGAVKAVISELVILNEAGIDVTEKLNITKYENSTVTITPRQITLGSGSTTKVYDGTPAASTEEIIKGDGFVPGEGVTFNISGSQLDVGQSRNGFTYAAFANTDLNDYIVTKLEGILTIVIRHVTLTSPTAEKAYDGTPLTAKDIEVTEEGWAEGEGATYNVTGSQTLVGESDNTFTYALNANTKAKNYVIKTEIGTLTVTTDPAKEGTYTVYYKEQTTGIELAQPFYATGLAYGDLYTEKAMGIPGFTALNPTEQDVIADGSEITFWYSINNVDTTIRITPDSGSRMYDGTPFTKNSFSLEGRLFSGMTANATGMNNGASPGNGGGDASVVDRLTAQLSGSVTHVAEGEVENKVESYQILRTVYGGTIDVTDCYTNITAQTGKLFVTPRPVTLAAGSAEKVYDSRPLTSDVTFIRGEGFAPGEGVKFNITGSQLDVGVSRNEFTYDLTDGTAATDYVFTKMMGTLTVTERHVRLISFNASRGYNGEPLVYHELSTYGDGWVEGQEPTIYWTGTITELGTAPNSFEVVLSKNAKAKNYDVRIGFGELEITDDTDITVNVIENPDVPLTRFEGTHKDCLIPFLSIFLAFLTQLWYNRRRKEYQEEIWKMKYELLGATIGK